MKKYLTSSVGKKFLMALSGLALVGFTAQHLLGNLGLYLHEGSVFNGYAQGLKNTFGPALPFLEVGLVGLFLFHIVLGVGLAGGNRAARPERYRSSLKTKGQPSRSNLSSRNMIITGAVLAIFLVIHLLQFRFGPGMDDGYVASVNGKQALDLHRLVVETFTNPLWVVFYVGTMIFMGFHLRHAFWSAFQSLGMQNPRYHGTITCLGVIIAIALALGFVGIPLWIYFDPMGGFETLKGGI